MLVRCGPCGYFASTEKPCTHCGSQEPMRHTHECAATHYYTVSPMKEGTPEAHDIRQCPNMHVHPHAGRHDHTDTGSIEIPTRVSPTREERIAFILTIPWISKVRGKHVPCDGYTSSRKDKKCRNNAKFKYRALKRSMFTSSGNYCWSHLPIHDMEEESRFHRWLAKNPIPWVQKEDNDGS